MGGALLGAKALLEEAYRDLIRHTGPSMSPFNAWVLLKGLETLELRVRRQSETAAALADLIPDCPVRLMVDGTIPGWESYEAALASVSTYQQASITRRIAAAGSAPSATSVNFASNCLSVMGTSTLPIACSM